MTLESFSQKKQELADILDKKIAMINGLVSAGQELASLATLDSEESLATFPIESIIHLPTGKQKNILGGFKKRKTLLKSCNTTLDELDVMDGKIRLLVMDLVIEKINIALESK